MKNYPTCLSCKHVDTKYFTPRCRRVPKIYSIVTGEDRDSYDNPCNMQRWPRWFEGLFANKCNRSGRFWEPRDG